MTRSKYRDIRFWIGTLGTLIIFLVIWLTAPELMSDYPNLISTGILFFGVIIDFLFDLFMKWKYPAMILRIFPDEHDERALHLKGKAAYKLLQLILMFAMVYIAVLGISETPGELFYFISYSTMIAILAYSIILWYYKKSE